MFIRSVCYSICLLFFVNCTSTDKMEGRVPASENLSCPGDSNTFEKRVKFELKNSSSFQEGIGLKTTIKLTEEPLASLVFNSKSIQSTSSWVSDVKRDFIVLEIEANRGSARATTEYHVNIMENCNEGVVTINLTDFYKLFTLDVEDTMFDDRENLALLRVKFNNNQKSSFSRKKTSYQQFILLANQDGSFPESVNIQLQAIARGRKPPANYVVSTDATQWLVSQSEKGLSIEKQN